MKIAAFDTGFQTGIATFDTESGEHLAWDAPADEAMDWLGDELAAGNLDVVVIERITITVQTAKKGDQVLTSVEQIGAARHLCRWYGLDFVDDQSPAEAKGFATDSKLHAHGWWTVGSDHARDASRHLMLRLCKVDTGFRQAVSDNMEGT